MRALSLAQLIVLLNFTVFLLIFIMFKLIVAFTLVVCVTAYGGGSGSGGYSSGGAGSGTLLSSSSGYSSGGQGGQTIQAAIQTKHSVQYYDVPSSGSVNPTTIEVGASHQPLSIVFRSASSSLNIQQIHDGAQGSTQETSSHDEPHILKHSVTKPIIQEVREIITPQRKIVQEIQPVQEHIETIVAKAQEQPQQQQQQLQQQPQQLSAPRTISAPSPTIQQATPIAIGFLGSSRPLGGGSGSGSGSAFGSSSSGSRGGASLGSLGSTKGGY